MRENEDMHGVRGEKSTKEGKKLTQDLTNMQTSNFSRGLETGVNLKEVKIHSSTFGNLEMKCLDSARIAWGAGSSG